MSDVTVELTWEEGERLGGTSRGGHPVVVDGSGGAGPKPTEMLLMSLAACMGIDVVDILTKMRVPMRGLTVRAEADRRPEPPRRFTAVRLIYSTEGVAEGDRAKLQRAVDLSRDTYCSVLHTLQPDLDLSIQIETG